MRNPYPYKYEVTVSLEAKDTDTEEINSMFMRLDGKKTDSGYKIKIHSVGTAKSDMKRPPAPPTPPPARLVKEGFEPSLFGKVIGWFKEKIK